jgi:hypothetical protein
MTANATLSANLNFGIVGEIVTAQIAIEVPYAAVSSGQIDIPASTPDDTAYTLPMSTIGSCLGMYIKNTNESDIAVRFNSASADEFQISPGAAILIAMPTAPGAAPITVVKVVTTAIQVAPGNVQYALFGT